MLVTIVAAQTFPVQRTGFQEMCSVVLGRNGEVASLSIAILPKALFLKIILRV